MNFVIYGEDKLLMEQTYPGEEDIEMHFSYLNRAFRDKRYIKIDGMPLLVVYDPIVSLLSV